MKIEIFVVKTLNPNQKRLDSIKESLIRLFNGLTVIPNCDGYWQDNKYKDGGTIWHDKVEIWQIYTDFKEKTAKKALKPYLTIIQGITQQTSQAYALNNEIYFI